MGVRALRPRGPRPRQQGIRHLAELLSQPGVEVHALDLVRVGDAGVSAAASADAGLSLGAGAGAGSALDGAAKAAYAGGSRTCARSSTRRSGGETRNAPRGRARKSISSPPSFPPRWGSGDGPAAGIRRRARPVNVHARSNRRPPARGAGRRARRRARRDRPHGAVLRYGPTTQARPLGGTGWLMTRSASTSGCRLDLVR